jgi:26S proteasome regulatory subunit N5
MSDIQVETFSSMDKREKTELSVYQVTARAHADSCSILEQMRLESLRGNWVKVRVGSRKINRVYLKEKDSAVSTSCKYVL